MSPMKKRYVEKRDGGYWVADTRVSLDSIVYEFNKGEAPEAIRRNFSVLTLEEVYGALTFYLANQQMVDEYLRVSEERFEREADERRQEMRRKNPDLFERLYAAKVVS